MHTKLLLRKVMKGYERNMIRMVKAMTKEEMSTPEMI